MSKLLSQEDLTAYLRNLVAEAWSEEIHDDYVVAANADGPESAR